MYLRQELAMCFKYASASTEAWDALVDLKCIDKLVEYVAVDNKLLRGNALSALNDCCLSDRARDVLVNNGKTLQFILKRINEETDRVNTVAALDVLSKCVIGLNYCEKAMKELLNVNAVSTALRLMDSPFLDLKEAATRFLCLICFHIKGKDQAIKQGAIEKLLPYLHHIEPRIQIFGLAALMSITIAVEGKFRIVFAGGVPYIKPMLDLTDDVICLYVLQLMINTAHHPGARAKLQDCIPILRKMITESTSAWLKRTCRQGIQQLQFTSRPYPNLRFVSMKEGMENFPLYSVYTSLPSAKHCKIHARTFTSFPSQRICNLHTL
ncbi:hypothetical protein KC19_3G026800 [Ceratodon purpureus]|nr:hypothetical protein KC19_3G026800 [Ceratodon purpureus]